MGYLHLSNLKIRHRGMNRHYGLGHAVPLADTWVTLPYRKISSELSPQGENLMQLFSPG